MQVPQSNVFETLVRKYLCTVSAHGNYPTLHIVCLLSRLVHYLGRTLAIEYTGGLAESCLSSHPIGC